MPPEIRAQRSIFIRKLDHEIGTQPAEKMKEVFEAMNEWMKIEEVIKIKDYNHVVKIRFTETAMADRAITHGFLGFNLSITPDQVKREKCVNLLTCFNCYEYENHTTNDCPNKEVKQCSECAEEGHTFRECTNINSKA